MLRWWEAVAILEVLAGGRQQVSTWEASVDPDLETAEVPASVTDLVRAALAGELLADVDTMAAHLERAGWVRQRQGGQWSCPGAPAWSVISGDHAPNLSVFTHGPDDVVAQAAQRIRALIDAGDLGSAARGEADPDWASWSAGSVTICLNATTGRPLGRRWVKAMIQLAAGRQDTPPEGLAEDPERDLRVARDGSPVARWHLASKEVLPAQVIALLAADHDRAVVAALAAGESQRLIREEQNRSLM